MIEARSRIHRRGFTLVELLVAVAIFSVLIGSLYGLFFGALRLRETAANAEESALPREQAEITIQRDLTNVVVPSGVLAGPLLGEKSKESGQIGERIEFFSTTGIVSDREAWGEIQKVEYFLTQPDNRNMSSGLDLIRKMTRNLLSTTVDEKKSSGTVQTRLLRGVESMEIRYWDGTGWLDSWDTTAKENANPKAVRVRVLFADASAKEHGARPLEVICETSTQPRATPTPTPSGS